MNYSVALRTRELGLRLAVGAQPRQVLLLVLKQGFWLTIIGVVLGLAAALALTRLLSGLLFGVAAIDVTTFATISVLLGSPSRPFFVTGQKPCLTFPLGRSEQ